MNTKYRLKHKALGALALALLLTVLAACTQNTAAEDDADLRPITVENVQVQVGVGSPIPVDVFVSGSWPDLCAQLAEITQEIEGTQINISLLTTPADENCPPDFVGLPFRIAIPLNAVELPVDTYTVTVNGTSTTFAWDQSGGTP